MARLKITSEQYKNIVLFEHKSRLEQPSTLIHESGGSDTENTPEGWNEVILGVAILLDRKLSGLNKINGDKAIKNSSIMSKIRDTIENKDRAKALADSLENKGISNAKFLLAKNSREIMIRFNEISEINGLPCRINNVDNLISLDSAIAKAHKEKLKAKSK